MNMYPFAAVPNSIIRSGVGAIHLAVFAAVLSHCGVDGECFASQKTIADELGISRDSVKRSLDWWAENAAKFNVVWTEKQRLRQPSIITITVTKMDSEPRVTQTLPRVTQTLPRVTQTLPRVTQTPQEEPTKKKNKEQPTPTPLPPPTDGTTETAIAAPSGAVDGVNTLMAVFYDHGNTGIKFGNKTIRKDAEWLIQKYGLEQIVKLATWACSIQGQPYAPLVGTPTQLREKLLALQAFAKRNSESKVITI